ncbi:MAG: protein kinase [Planctomycetes bacterium]|nr:protein kinase [Planctomycetota bacterium]
MGSDLSTAQERLYDAWLDRALAGSAEDVDAYCARHDALDSELHRRLRALAALSKPGNPRAAKSGLPFQRLGEFRLLEPLGEGGSGLVYRAEQMPLGREVALKILRPELRQSLLGSVRLMREARALSRVRHENIVGLHALGEQEGVVYLVFELVDGETLSQRLARAKSNAEPIPVRTLVRWAADLAHALDVVHREGIVHRDVKPDNIRIAADGRVVLMDFGLARDVDGTAPSITRSFVGSPAYAAPEQIDASRGEVTPRTDVYSLGITLYEALTGAPPFHGDSIEAVFRSVLQDPLPDLGRIAPHVPRDLALVVATAIEKNPLRRYPDAAALARDLEAVLEWRPISVRPPNPFRRLLRATRRRPLLSAVLTVGALVGPIAGWIERSNARQAAVEARALVESAEDAIEAHVPAALSAANAFLRRKGFERTQQWRWLGERERTLAAQADLVLAEYAPRRDELLRFVENRLAQARELDPNIDVGVARNRLEYLRFVEAARRGEFADSEEFRDALTRTADPGAAGVGTLEVDADPGHAEVHLLRLVPLSARVSGGDARMVPVSLTGSDVLEPGTTVLVPEVSTPDLELDDAIVALDGAPVANDSGAKHAVVAAGTRLALFRAGSRRDVVTTTGVSMRATAAAALLRPETRIEQGTGLALHFASYLLVATAPGHETLRLPFAMNHGGLFRVRLVLQREGTTPAGFVRIPCEAWVDDPHPGFLIRRFEVTCAEFRTFLDASGHVPDGSTWRSVDDGTRLPTGCGPDHPAIGVSWNDASAYVAWLRRTRAAPAGMEFALPTFHEFIQAAIYGGPAPYVHGYTWRQDWQKSRVSGRGRTTEPIGSYVLDESAFGVRDLQGSAMEWLEPPAFDDGGPERALAGGSWLDGNPAAFRLDLRHAAMQDDPDPAFGFRVVLVPTEGRR